MLSFLVGGARSGKSRLAVEVAGAVGGDAVTVVVTAEAGDAEMAARIARHQHERPASWHVVDAPRDLPGALARIADDRVVLVDCLSIWVANEMLAGVDDHRIEAVADEAAAWAGRRAGAVIAVSNEVGSGVVPPSELGRRFRDVLGRVNATWSSSASDAWLVVAGRPLALGDPATVVDVARSRSESR